MNERLQGWRLALAVLIPIAVIAGALYVVLGNGDTSDVATGDTTVEPTATSVAETQPVDEATAAPDPQADPTPLPVPTALTVPTVDAAALPAPTQVPTVEPTAEPAPTAVPAPTADPGPAPTAGPTPTATPDPSVTTLTCVGDVPGSTDTDGSFGPLTAEIFPAEAAASYQIVWNLGDGTVVTNPTSGTISYAQAGTYQITAQAQSITDDTAISATCGTVTVAAVAAPFIVRCSVTVTAGNKPLAEARASDTMTVTTTWTPADKPLNLTYEFDTSDDLVIVPNAATGNQQTNAFDSDSSSFSIFWRDAETGETGLLDCPAYPGTIETGPTPTPIAGEDSDEDGIEDPFDNCINDPNADQLNTDGDAEGDECDDDDDNDNRVDQFDNCPKDSNFDQVDSNANGIGDACEVAPTPTATAEATDT